MSVTVGTLTDPKSCAKYMEKYARSYNAGAFAMPLAKDVEKAMLAGEFYVGNGVVFAHKVLTRDSKRKSFDGNTLVLEKGTRVVTHLAGEQHAQLPNMSAFGDVVRVHLEDTNVTDQLKAQGFKPIIYQVSAAAELLAFYGLREEPYLAPLPVDVASLVKIPLTVTEDQQEAIIREVTGQTGWYDDNPFYSDGSWDAVNLRGFDPNGDQTFRAKPATESKAWKAENPDKLDWTTCTWTTVADRMPLTRALVESLGFVGLERVSLLRMQGRDGKGGVVARHTDVADKAIGTRDGQLIRFFIPIVTDPRNVTAVWNLDGKGFEQHLGLFDLWYLDARKPHAIYNRSGKDRIHLSFDAIADQGARDKLLAGTDVAV